MKLALGLVKLAIGLGVVVYLVVDGCGRAKHDDANRGPGEAMRQARDIHRMWADGFHAHAVPIFPPARAEELLRGVEASGADEGVRAEATALLAALGKRPNYIRFACNAAAFKTEAPKYLAAHAAASDGPEVDAAVEPDLLVMTVKTEPDAPPQAYFDAEMVEACGPAAAADPARVRTLVTLVWGREKVGEFRMTDIEVNGRRVKVSEQNAELSRTAAYRETCRLTAIRLADGVVVGRRTFEEDPPAERRGADGGEKRLRARVAGHIDSLRGVSP